LIALAINLVLSFGHVHSLDRAPVNRLQGALLAAIAPSHDAGSTGGHDRDGHPDDFCPICLAAAAVGNAVTAAPPVLLPAEFASIALPRIFANEFALPQSPRTGFRSRGPPSLLTSLG